MATYRVGHHLRSELPGTVLVSGDSHADAALRFARERHGENVRILPGMKAGARFSFQAFAINDDETFEAVGNRIWVAQAA